MKKKTYVAPETEKKIVELENGFMKASIFEAEDQHDEGLSTEEHGFANPGASWEGDYSDGTWD